MDANSNKQKKRRGPYKKYITDPDVPIPRKTKNDQSKKREIETDDSEMSTNNGSEYEIPVHEIAGLSNIKKRKRMKCKVKKPITYESDDSQNECNNLPYSDCIEDLPSGGDEFDVVHSDVVSSSSESDNDIDIVSDENDSNYDSIDSDDELSDESNENPVSDKDEFEIINEPEELLTQMYEGSRLTKLQSNLITLAYSLRHNLPDVGLENLVSLLDSHLPENALRSKYQVVKYLPIPTIKEHYFCEACLEILAFDNQQNADCPLCGKVFKKIEMKKKGQFFIGLSLKQQLQEILTSDLSMQLRNSCQESDVINGKVYRNLRQKNIIGPNDITLQINVDGVSLSKSSKASLWPILVTINELPYRTRKSNVLICGLWYGENKPNINMYLKPFVEELVSLSVEGIKIVTNMADEPFKAIKVHTIVCPVDSVARAMVQNWKQFNGSYGCPYCMHKGERIPVGRGYSRVYCYSETRDRTSADYEKHLKLAVNSGKVVKGVRGPSIINFITGMHVIHSCPPDYLHQFLLGVVKLFVRGCFDSKYKNDPFYLGSHLEEFHSRLLKIQPPSEITRTPRPITDTYKANEWRNFLLYYSTVCFKGIMKTRYFNHWGLLVFALHKLLQEKITKQDLKQAKDALHSFVKQVETLYKKEFLRFNVHLLLHLPKFVSLYGALWAWSTFPFEGFNGVIRHLYFGTQYIPLQITKLYCRLRYLRNHSYIFNSDDINPKVLTTFLTLMDQCKVRNCMEYGNNLRAFGKPTKVTLSVLEKHVVEQEIGGEIYDDCEGYNRFIYNHVLFHSINYNKLRKRNNSVVQTHEGQIMKIARLLGITCSETKEIKYVLIGSELKITDETLYTATSTSIDSQGYCYIVRDTANIICCSIDSIKTKCVDIIHPTSAKRCIFLLVNKLETD